MGKLFEYVGVIHIHTTDSDGTKSHEQIIRLAQRYGIDFLMFSDHMTLSGKRKEGWYGETLVLVGYEHEDQNERNHYLIFGLDEPLGAELSPAEYVRQARILGALGIIAHPDERRNFPKYPPLPWTEWSVDEFDGIEIWNHMSAWLEGIADGRRLRYIISPRRLLVSPPRATLRRWDEIAQRRKVLGVAAADAHGYRYRIFGPFWKTIFPYRVELCSLRTHILLEEPLSQDFDRAQNQVLSAMRRCRAFICNYRWGDGRGFRLWAIGDTQRGTIGDQLDPGDGVRFVVEAPEPAEIILVRDGKRVDRRLGRSATFECREKGAYRVELWRRGRGWIFSNHIYLFPPGDFPKAAREGGR